MHSKRHQFFVIAQRVLFGAHIYVCRIPLDSTPFLCSKCSSYSVGSPPLDIEGCFDCGICCMMLLPSKQGGLPYGVFLPMHIFWTYPDNHRASVMTILPRQTILHCNREESCLHGNEAFCKRNSSRNLRTTHVS